MAPLIRALCRIDSGMDVPWNTTVRNMSLAVLRMLQEYDDDLFKQTCSDLSSPLRNDVPVVVDDGTGQRASLDQKSFIITSHNESPSTDMTSLKSPMG